MELRQLSPAMLGQIPAFVSVLEMVKGNPLMADWPLHTLNQIVNENFTP
jgi:hypothetical protein